MDRVLYRLSERFYASVMNPVYPRPSLFDLMKFRMSRTSIEKMLHEGYRDYTYYRDQGWFESSYFYPVRMGVFKQFSGKIFDWMAARASRKHNQPEA